MLFLMLIQGVGENACAKKSHEKYLIALKGSGLAFPEDKLACGMEEQGAGTSTLAVQGLCRKIFLREVLFIAVYLKSYIFNRQASVNLNENYLVQHQSAGLDSINSTELVLFLLLKY